jgi:uncharacterized protein
MAIPSRRECLEILRREGVADEVIDHARLVEALGTAIAEKIAEKHSGAVDLGLVVAGGLLHDLGRAKTHDIRHAQYGVEMAEEMGMDPRIVEIIRRHVGGGVTHEEAKALGLPEWDGMPRTLEEKIVCHADTLVGANGRRTLKQTIKHIKRKGSSLYLMRVKELHTYLSGLAERDIDTFGPWTLPRKGRKRKHDIDMPPLPPKIELDNIKYP